MKKIFSVLLLLSLMSLSVILVNVFADSGNVSAGVTEASDKKLELYKAFSARIMEEKTCIKSFSYIEEAAGKEKMIDVIAEYNKVYSDSKAYLMLKNSINSIYEEAAANNFSKQQVKDLFIATTRLEMRSGTENEMSFSPETPNVAPSHAEKKGGVFPYSVYVNGTPIELKNILLNHNTTFIALREFCEQIGMQVVWSNPNYHQLPIPGGNFPPGINIINPSFVYVKEVTDYHDTDKKIKGVDITGIYHKYRKREGSNFKYYFTERGIVVDGEKLLELSYNPSNQHMYVSIEEFKEKIQPYFVDICTQ